MQLAMTNLNLEEVAKNSNLISIKTAYHATVIFFNQSKFRILPEIESDLTILKISQNLN